MSEASSPLKEHSYKLRTHSNFNLMFQRVSQQYQVERLSVQDNGKNVKPDETILNHPLLTILQRPHRQISDGMNIYDLIKDYSFFKEFFTKGKINHDLDKIYQLCTKLQLEVFKEGQVILKEGVISNDKMYLIIVGRVLILKKNQNPKHKVGTLLQKEVLQSYIKKFGEVINDLNPGNYFGEKALMEEQSSQAVRTATCIADSDVYLMSLNRWEFLEVLGQFKKDADTKLEIFHSVFPHFDKVGMLVIENLMYSFNEEFKQRDDTITQEGQDANVLYILIEGEVAIMKRHQNHQMLLCSLHNQQIIGEESLFKDQYYYTIVVNSQRARLLKISSESFQLKAWPECISGLKKIMEKKYITRMSLLQTIIKKSNEHRQQQDQFVKERNISQLDNDFRTKYYGITHRCMRKLESTINGSISQKDFQKTNQSNSITLLNQLPIHRSLENYALFQQPPEEKKYKRNKFTQSIQFQQLQQKLGIKTQQTQNPSPSKQQQIESENCKTENKDISSRTQSIYTINNKNSTSNRTIKESSLLQKYLQNSQINTMKQRILSQKKSYLIKSIKQLKDLNVIKIRCQTLEQ